MSLGFNFVTSPADCLKVGDEVQCVVIKVDAEDSSIPPTKMLEDKPGEMMKDSKAVFERAKATVEAGNERWEWYLQER